MYHVYSNADGGTAGRAAGGGCVLLVEDHADTLAAMSRLLRSTGHAVRTAGTVGDAMLAAERAAAQGEPVRVLVSDIQLPDGNGLDLVRHLQARYGVRAIAVTGRGDDYDERDSLAAGFDLFLEKPPSIERLLAGLTELRGHGATA